MTKSKTIKSIPDLAIACGISIATVERALRSGELTRGKNGVFNVDKAKDVFAARALRRGGQPLGGKINGASPELRELNILKAKEELEMVRAKRIRIEQENRREAGDTLIRSEVKSAVAAMVIEFRDALSTLAPRVASKIDPRRAKEIAGIIQEHVDGILSALANTGEGVTAK